MARHLRSPEWRGVGRRSVKQECGAKRSADLGSRTQVCVDLPLLQPVQATSISAPTCVGRKPEYLSAGSLAGTSGVCHRSVATRTGVTRT